VNASRARRRWLRWQRYAQATGTTPSRPCLGGHHHGMSRAFSDTLGAARRGYIGVRSPWFLTRAKVR
jgi:hypothetical protein